jgi:hypothetical protein
VTFPILMVRTVVKLAPRGVRSTRSIISARCSTIASVANIESPTSSQRAFIILAIQVRDRTIDVLLLALALAFSTPAFARCYRCEHRRPEAKREFKLMTGYPHGRPGYVIDHVVPLACGGEDSPRNLQWQTIAEGKAKDRWERNCAIWGGRAYPAMPAASR